ncbi:MAG TPA: S53 family peptidase, partial [Planctomycetaceae bacterium]|nr:S53 family peptidase [Planctomycetaceae bacterium]
LEDRTLLAAAALPTPTFILKGIAPAPGTSRSVSPATQSGVAPIDPAQMQAAYGVNLISFGGVQGTGEGQTITIVDAYNDPNIVSDAQTFSTQFGLPQFNVSGGPTLQVLNETGGPSLPSNATAGTWDVEESLDVEWAHAIAPQANIILFEANTANWSDLLNAEQTAAATAGVSVVSNSWGGGEYVTYPSYDSSFLTPSGHQGVTFLASTGDDGAPALYPAYSPNVVAVGGTTLNVASSGDYLSESAWTDGGGGISIYESQPAYQTGKVNGTSATQRTAPDISMDADPNTGVYVLDSFYSSSYLEVGGTSLSCPMMAGLIAIANQGRALNGLSTLDGESQTLPALYDLASANFHDITTGDNGWPAGPGYDLATGLGTPIANLLVPALAGYQSTVTSPASITIYGSNSYTFSGGSISVTDPAATGSSDSLTLSVANGTLTLDSTAGLKFVSGANGTSSMTVTGTETNLNAALNGLVYTPTASFGFSGVVQDYLQLSVNDANNSQTGMARVNITVIGPPIDDSLPISTPVTVESGSSLNIPTDVWDADAVGTSTSDSVAIAVADGTLTLASTAGLTFESGSNGSSSMTVTGTLMSLNNDLEALVYAPNAGFTGSDSLQVSITNSIDNLTGSATVPISVYSAPAILAPSNWYASEDSVSSTSSNPVSIFDPAASGTSDLLTLSVAKGWLTFPSAVGLTFTSGSNDSSSMTVSGTVANLNAALAGLSYTPNYGYFGSDTMHLSLVDAGNNTASTVAVPITISIPLPDVTVLQDGAYGVAEDGFNFPILSAFRLEDPIAEGNSDSLTLSVTNGTISISPALLFPNSDVTLTAGADGSSSFTLNGPISQLNGLASENLRYTPNPGYAGPDWLKASLLDSGDGLSASGVAVINAGPAAFVYAPGSANVAENVPYTFAGTVGLIDAGAVATSDSLTLQAYQGSLTLDSTAGLTFTAGSNGSSLMTVTGTLVNLNAAVDDLVFTPNSNYTGITPVDISAYDSVDRGGSHVSVELQVEPPPSITAPPGVSLNENNSYSFSGGSITVADSFAVGNGYDDSLSLSVSDGTLLLASTNGLTFSSGSNGSSSMAVTGTVANLNIALNGLVYTPSAGYSGADSLHISLSDPGDTLSSSAAVAITVNAPPAVTAPAAASVNENGSYTFAGTISLTDSAAGSAPDSLTLSVSHGTLTLPTTTGLTFTTGSNGAASFTVTGTVANLNAALSRLTYAPATGYSGSDSLAISVSDPGDRLSASASVALTVNSPPAITAPASASVTLGSTLVFSTANKNAITISDVNAGSSAEPLTITVTDGTVSLGSTTGITFTSGSNNSASMSITGTLANLDNALSGLVFTPANVGSATVVLSYTDVGDALKASATINITVSKAPTKLALGSPVSPPSPAPAVAGGSAPSAPMGASVIGTTSDDLDTSIPPDALTQWQGLAAAVDVLST